MLAIRVVACQTLTDCVLLYNTLPLCQVKLIKCKFKNHIIYQIIVYNIYFVFSKFYKMRIDLLTFYQLSYRYILRKELRL